MVRSSTYRASKYDAKIVGDVIKNRIDAQKTSMVSQATTQFGLLVAKEEAIKEKLTTWGVGTIQVPFYLAYGRKIYGLSRKHAGDILHDEVCIAYDAWVSRGLDPYYLQSIAMDVFSVDISDCT